MAVYPKGNRWYIDYYIKGERKREAVSIPGVDPSKITRSDAEKALSIRKSEIAQGKFDIIHTKRAFSFEKLIDMYLDWAKDNHKAPERDIAASKPLLLFFSGKKVDQINLWLIEKYKSHRKSLGRKPETINKELGVLRRMFNLAMEWKEISTNPVKGMKLLKVPKSFYRVLKDSEFQKLYQTASPHFKPILLCAYFTGMRRGEIAHLKWDDLDLTDGYILVKESKNNEPRSIPICEILLKTLRGLKENLKSEFVFTTHEGEPYKSTTAWKRAWTTALKKSGIGKCRFHDLRHTFTSNLIVGLKEDHITVKALTGHKDTRMLQRYSHTSEEYKRKAISKLGNSLNLDTMDTYLDTNDENQQRTAVNAIDLTTL